MRLLAPAAAALAAATLAAASSAAPPPRYYLALGDSLAQGVQPDAQGRNVLTRQGYADDLYALERHQVHGLKLVKLGCPGERTGSMIAGGVCNDAYARGNQLDDAVAFLQSHRVALVTIDIGSNDVDRCVQGTSVDTACVAGGVASVEQNLPVILSELHAASPSTRIVAMNYYDPFLAAWLEGDAGQALAQQSVQLTTTFNGVLAQIYGRAGIRVADVAGAFMTTKTTTVPLVKLPVDVATICTLTWMCKPPPVGPNIHANRAGYALIAGAFAKTVGRLR